MDLKHYIKTGSDEDEFVKLVSIAIREYRLEKGLINADEDNCSCASYKTNFNKICFDVADKLNSPITRSWYIFGTHIEYENSELFNIQQNLVIDMSSPLAKFYLDIETAVRESIKEFNMFASDSRTNKTLEKLYKEKAPEAYKELYISNLGLLNAFDEIKYNSFDEAFRSKSKSDHKHVSLSQNFIKNSNKFIESYLKLDGTFEKYQDSIIKYLSLCEDILIKYDLLIENENKITEDMYKNLISLKSIYTSDFWVMPACVISMNTMVGLRRNEESNRKAELLKTKDYYDDKVNKDLETTSRGNNLLLTSTESEQLLDKEYGKEFSKLHAIHQQHAT